MPSFRHSSRIDTLGLKAEIIRKIGHQRANKYFHNLQRLLSLKLSKSEFDKVCIGAIGRENVSLHNQLIGSIINNACTAKKPPPKRTVAEDSVNVKSANGYHRSNLQSLLGDVLPPSPRKGRSSNLRDRKFRDRPSPLGPHYKVNNIISDESVNRTQEQQSATELVSLGSKPPVEGVSVEDGEEVEQKQVTDNPGGVQSRSPVRAPLGISIGRSSKALRSNPLSASHPENCCNRYELPDSLSLKKRLERKLEAEGLGISMDCVNLLNNGLDAFLKRLIRPCMELTRSRSGSEHLQQVNGQVIPGSHGVGPNPSFCASLLDFRAAMELNPQLLGEDWPVQLERLSFRTTEMRE